MADDFSRALLDALYAPDAQREEPAPTRGNILSQIEDYLRRRQEKLPAYAGTGEALATGISALAGSVPAGLAGLAELARTRDPSKAAQRVENVQEALTYIPRTEPGARALERAAKALAPLGVPAEKAGEFVLERTGSPGAATAASIALDPLNLLTPGVAKGAVKGIKAAPRVAGRIIEESLMPASSREAQRGAIKMKGGNWLAGEVEGATEPLRPRVTTERLAEYTPEQRADPAILERAKRNDALNNWIDKKLNRYIKNEMATPEDPVRKLAEQGILHYQPPAESRVIQANAQLHRGNKQPLGQNLIARQWEDVADAAIFPQLAEYQKAFGNIEKNPWLEKVSPETEVYGLSGGSRSFDQAGFGHLIDELKNSIRPDSDLPVHLRWKPEDLEKVTMEQAVRRVHDINKYRESKKAEANEALARNPATVTFKEYPTVPGSDKPNEKGLTWKEIRAPQDAMPIDDGFGNLSAPGYVELEQALKYEGDVMGHCVGGYCDDVMSGRTQIYSLRDKKGEPHVTIEVERPSISPVEWLHDQPRDIADQIRAQVGDRPTMSQMSSAVISHPKYQQDLANLPKSIVQIKGKGNAAPKAEYLPFVQDFVRGGNWSWIGDWNNTGLHDIKNYVQTVREAAEKAYPGQKYFTDSELQPIVNAIYENKKSGGAIRKAEGGEVTIPDMTDGGRVIDGGYFKKGGKVHISKNPDTMRMALMAGGGSVMLKAAEKAAEKVAARRAAKEVPPPLPRAEPKTKAEIEKIAERMAPQIIGEYVRKTPESAVTVAGKTKKQFEREKELPVKLKGEERKPEQVDIESLKDKVMIGILGDPSIAGRELESVGDIRLESAAPQHGGPLYGMGQEGDVFWASGKGAAQKVQNLAEEASKQYGADVLGKYIMMGPEGLNYAQHFADANLQAIDLSKMNKRQVEGFNNLIRKGSPNSGPRPSFPGIEDKEGAYLHLAFDPELRKHFNALMQMNTVTDKFNLPNGQDIRYAITEPLLRDLERGVAGMSIGEMRPGQELTPSSHPTYEMDIPGRFKGMSKYPIPYELMFPDTVKSIRENPRQAPHEFGSLGMVGPRQIVDQQMIDEIKAYEERIKKLTGKKKGGSVKKPAAKGGKVSFATNPKEMRLELQKKRK